MFIFLATVKRHFVGFPELFKIHTKLKYCTLHLLKTLKKILNPIFKSGYNIFLYATRCEMFLENVHHICIVV